MGRDLGMAVVSLAALYTSLYIGVAKQFRDLIREYTALEMQIVVIPWDHILCFARLKKSHYRDVRLGRHDEVEILFSKTKNTFDALITAERLSKSVQVMTKATSYRKSDIFAAVLIPAPVSITMYFALSTRSWKLID